MSELQTINQAIEHGLAPLRVAPPMSLSEWSRQHFYLSQESSYTQGAWTPYPFQVVPMDCMSCDDIEEFVWRKSKRIGYTKILLAYIAYTAHHKKRNQAIWQPTDDDAISFVKTELDPAVRDMEIMSEVFPNFMKRHSDNSLKLKKFIGSLLHILGGKAAKNYRRITVDNALFDEIDAFDFDVEGEGSPYKLGSGRTEGSLFPKKIVGSTPKMKNWSLVEAREQAAEMFFEFYVPCPHCGELVARTRPSVSNSTRTRSTARRTRSCIYANTVARCLISTITFAYGNPGAT